MKSLFLLCLVFVLCSLSFVAGRSSEHLTLRTHHEMNELDRLQMETATQHNSTASLGRGIQSPGAMIGSK